MYDKGKKFYGNLAHYIDDLVAKRFFKRNTDVLTWAAVVGYVYGINENSNINDGDYNFEKNVSGEQVEQHVLDFLLRLFVIRSHANDTEDLEELKKELFTSKSFNQNFMNDFEKYINVGISVMHKKLCQNFKDNNDCDTDILDTHYNRSIKFIAFFKELSAKAKEMQ